MFFRSPLRLQAKPARLFLAALLFGTVSSSAVAQDAFEWSETFLAHIARVDDQTPGRLGVYVKDMETGIMSTVPARPMVLRRTRCTACAF